MANMTDAFMKGYGFVDNIRRQGVADERAKVEQSQRDTLFNATMADKVRADTEREGNRKGLGMLFDAVATDYGTTADKLQPSDKAVLEKVYTDPVGAAKGLEDFNMVKYSLDQGKMPTEEETTKGLNGLFGHDLERRFPGMSVSGVLPSQDGKNLMFQTAIATPDGATRTGHLTDGRTVAGTPGSEKDTVTQYPISQVMQQSGARAAGIVKALRVMATGGGTEGAQFATKYLTEQDATKRALIIKEYEHLRDRSEKKEDTKETRVWESAKMDQEHRNRLSERVPTADLEMVKDADGNVTGAFNKRTGAFSNTGMSAALGGPTRIVVDGRQVSDKTAQEMFKTGLGLLAEAKSANSGSLILGNLPTTVESVATMDPEQKQTLLAKAVELSKDSDQTIQVRSAANRVLSIGAQRGLFDNEPRPAMSGSVAAHGPQQVQPPPPVPQAGGPDLNGVMKRAAELKASRQPAAGLQAPPAAGPQAPPAAGPQAPPAAGPQAPPAAMSPAEQRLAELDQSRGAKTPGIIDTRGVKEIADAGVSGSIGLGKSVVNMGSAANDIYQAFIGQPTVQLINAVKTGAQRNLALKSMESSYTQGIISRDEFIEKYNALMSM